MDRWIDGSVDRWSGCCEGNVESISMKVSKTARQQDSTLVSRIRQFQSEASTRDVQEALQNLIRLIVRWGSGIGGTSRLPGVAVELRSTGK